VDLVIDAKTGAVDEQASIEAGSGSLIEFKKQAEANLWFFGRYVLGYNLLTKSLHLDVAKFIQKIPPTRKLLLLPRNHYKSTLSRAFAIHLLIQSDGRNVYFPNGFPHRPYTSDGRLTRILLASKTSDLAQLNLGEIAQVMEQNPMLRLLWPHCFWDDPRRAVRSGECAAWNNATISVRRPEVIREGSIETIGVGGVRTGYHFDVNIHDDLIDIKDRNSSAEMATAIEWHAASRAFLQDEDHCLELILGTHWAVNDLYTNLIEGDPTVEPYVRAIVEDGKPILPEAYNMQQIERMKRPRPEGYGNLFPLLFMNDAHDPELVDFDMSKIRYFKFKDGQISFEEDERDMMNRGDYDPDYTPTKVAGGADKWTGQKLTPTALKDISDEHSGRNEFLNFRYN
jgi:hypothetical protein